jgi:hypothetical protein
MAAAVQTTTAVPAVSAERDALVSALEARNATFTTLLRLIPQQYYVAPTDEEIDSKWMKNKKRKTGEEIKEHKRRARGDKVSPVELHCIVPHNTSSSLLTPARPLQPRSRDGRHRARHRDDRDVPPSRDACSNQRSPARREHQRPA